MRDSNLSTQEEKETLDMFEKLLEYRQNQNIEGVINQMIKIQG